MSKETPKQTEFYIKEVQKLIRGQVDSDRLKDFASTKSSAEMLRQLQQQKLNASKYSSKQSSFTEYFPRNSRPGEMNTMLKMYSKSKFQSGLLHKPTPKSIHQKELDKRTERMREQLLAQRLEQQKAHEDIAQALKKFDGSKNRVLPVEEINRECFRSQILRDPETVWMEVKSKNQEILDRKLKIGSTGFLRKPQQQPTEGQYDDQFESQELNRQNFETKRDKALMPLLEAKDGKILKILQAYFMQIILRTQSIERLQKKQTTQKLEQESIQFNPVPLYRDPPLPPAFQKATPNYSFTESLTVNDHFFPSEVITQHDAYKRSGKTTTFNPRHFTLSGRQLLYYGDDYKNVKKISVFIPQKLELVPFKKTEGRFWNKQEKQISMFTIKGEVEKGEKKEIMIEWNGLEGTELYDELVEYFAQKAYQIYCCLYEVVESRFQPFLRNKECEILDLSNDTLKMDRCRFSQETNLQFFEIWLKMIEFNKKIKIVDLKNSKLRYNCTEYILKTLTKQPLNILSLDVSNNKLSIESLKAYYSCLEQYTSIEKVTLSNCGISDEALQNVFCFLPSISSRMVIIDLSYNPLTATSLPLILKTLKKFNGVFIGDGLQLGSKSLPQFIKYQVFSLSLNNCNFVIDNSLLSETIAQLINNVTLKRILLRGNKCTFDYEMLIRLMADCKCLEEIGLDIPRQYIFQKQNPNSEWQLDYA